MATEKLFNCEGSSFADLYVRKELISLKAKETGDIDTDITVPANSAVIGCFLDNTNGETIAVTGATKATGTVTFTGTEGTTIASGTKVKTSTGIIFATTESATIAEGATTADAAVQAEVAGASGNVDAAAINALVTAVTGVSAVTNAEATSGGAESTFNIKVDSTSLLGTAVNVSAVSGKIVYGQPSAPVGVASNSAVKLVLGSKGTDAGNICVGLVLLEL